jgi:tyrosinase
MTNKFTSLPISIRENYRNSPFYRADLILEDVDHSGISYEGRVFLNNPNADETTPTTSENGYSDSFFVFGHGKCFGDLGHCEVRTGVRPYDKRSLHPLTPVSIRVDVTDAIRKIVQNSHELTVTVVPVIHTPDDNLDMEHCLKFKSIDLEIYGLPQN